MFQALVITRKIYSQIHVNFDDLLGYRKKGCVYGRR